MVENKNQKTFRKLVRNIINEFASSESSLVKEPMSQDSIRQDVVSRTVGKFVLPSTLSAIRRDLGELIAKINEKTDKKEIVNILGVLALEAILHHGNPEGTLTDGSLKNILRNIIMAASALKKGNLTDAKAYLESIQSSKITSVLSTKSKTVEVEEPLQKSDVTSETEDDLSTGDDSFAISDINLNKITENTRKKSKTSK